MAIDPNDVTSQLGTDSTTTTQPDAAPAPPDVSQLPATTQTQGNAPPLPRKQQGPPRPGWPIAVEAISQMIKPRSPGVDPETGVMRPASRLDAFENFLGNFVGALGQGLSVAHGPGAFGKGFGAAAAEPMQRAYQQYGMQQQQQLNQAQLQREQAQTELTEQQTKLMGTSVPLTLANGQQIYVPANQVGQYLKGGYAAGINAQERWNEAQLKSFVSIGQIGFVKPAYDQQGQPTYAAYDKQGNFVRFLDKSVDPAMLQKVTTTGQWLSDGAGGYMLAPKTTISGPALPGTSGPPSGFPRTAGVAPAAEAATPAPAGAAPSGFPRSGGPQPATGGGGQPRTMLGNEVGFAYDPVNKETVQTTPREAAANHWTQFRPVKQGEIDKYRASQVQFNDVQANTSRYTAAINAYKAANLSPAQRLDDQTNLHNLLNKAGVFDAEVSIAKGGEIKLPLISAITEGMSRESKTEAYRTLSPEAKALYDGYLRTMASVPAYQKALSGIGRSNKEMLDLELNNIPNPTLPTDDMLRRIGAYQENIDQGVVGIPRMPGIPTTKDIRAKFEATPQQAPLAQRPLPFPSR